MVVHTRLPSVGFRSWSRFLAASLQVTWVINPAVDCHYFPPGLQLPSQPLKGLLPILLFGEQRQNGCEQFAEDCYPTPTASRLQFEPRPFCAWVQHYNYSATEPPSHLLSFNSTALPCIHRFVIPQSLRLLIQSHTRYSSRHLATAHVSRPSLLPVDYRLSVCLSNLSKSPQRTTYTIKIKWLAF